jgi:hypothetical protein
MFVLASMFSSSQVSGNFMKWSSSSSSSSWWSSLSTTPTAGDNDRSEAYWKTISWIDTKTGSKATLPVTFQLQSYNGISLSCHVTFTLSPPLVPSSPTTTSKIDVDTKPTCNNRMDQYTLLLSSSSRMVTLT